MGLFKKIIEWKKRIQDPLYDYENWETEENWDKIVYDRDDLKISDKSSRENYVRGCLEQIAEASREVDVLLLEYEEITSKLKDMEEIEALPEEEMLILMDLCKQINSLKEQQADYLKRSHHMSEAKFRKMERMEDEISEAYSKLKDTEEYQGKIKKDLRRLENEKQAYFIRRDELSSTVEDCKSMLIILAVAICICLLVLLVLQYAFKMNTQIGYLASMLAGAIGITMIYIRHSDSKTELKSTLSGITRIIQLQNTVKIRYVNNTNLLDYLYMKYQVSSAEELGKDYGQYLEEKEERERFSKAELAMSECEQEFLHNLRRYQVKDPLIWLHQTEAILDKREMVEIRHKLIIQRQSLRRRIDYNREVVAANAQNEIKDLVDKYPKYAKELLEIVDEYEKKYK